MSWRSALVLAAAVFPGSTFCGGADGPETARLTFRITDAEGRPIPCRIHLKDAAGKSLRAPKLPFFRDHFVCPGTATLTLSPGSYRFEIERGPEYAPLRGTVKPADDTEVKRTLKRIDDLAAAGWYAGDLHVHRAVKDIKLLMRAEDLHVAPVITWWNNRTLWKDRKPPRSTLVTFDGDRCYDAMAGEDEREGGALMFFGLKKPLAITGSSREFPSPMKFVAEARKRNRNVWIDVEKPFWWDVPVWLASGQVDSVGLANNHMCRSRMYVSEAWGRPRDAKRLPAPRGNGFWTQEIYYHILNCGISLPPSAGSASGVLPNPVGYNRVYVHTGRPFSYEKWWAGLKAGRSFVTNGPLLIVRADGHLPGHVFREKEGERRIALTCRLRSNDPVEKIEIIKNGDVVRTVPAKEAMRTGSLGSLTFKTSGWFLIRAVAENRRTFRFASTAPFYVEIGADKRRISKRSVRFFQRWVEERIKRVPLKLKDPDKLKSVLAHHERAKRYWADRLSKANAD